MELEFTDPLVRALTTELVQGLEASDLAAYWRAGAYRIVVEPEVLAESVTVSLPAYMVKGVGEGVSAWGGNNYPRYNRASNVVVRETEAAE